MNTAISFIKRARASGLTLTFIVLVVCLLTVFLAWQSAQTSLEAAIDGRLATRVRTVEAAVQKRLAVYEAILLSGKSLYQANENSLSRQQWKNFVDTLDIRGQHPGLQGVGYALVIAPGELAVHEQRVRNEGFPGYSVHPAGPRDSYTSIVYLEPFDKRNQRAFGYDMFTEPIRRAAMEAARDSGEIAISHTVELVQETDTDIQAGFLIYVPVYAVPNPASPEERRALLEGYIYAPIRVSDLFEGLIGNEVPDGTHVAVYDGASTNAKLIYESDGRQNHARSVTQEIRLENVEWTIVVSANATSLQLPDTTQPQRVIFGGLIATFLLVSFIQYVIRTRAKELEFSRQTEIQQAKDDLLSLASHQLRTPATGVKQYISMVLQGYAGRITKQQRAMLQKAFVSNERQIEIINQILHVARLETGRIKLSKSKENIVAMVQELIDEQASEFAAREQQVTYKPQKKRLYARVDSQYMRMAIENLLTNASKYTHPGGKITITVKEVDNKMEVKVSDTGVGISGQDLPKLYEKFSRIDNELSMQVGGSGIGLYLAKQVVDMHRGSIAVDSTPSRGSTFTIKFPK